MGGPEDPEPRENFQCPHLALWDTQAAWPSPRLFCTPDHPPPQLASDRASTHRASARGRIRTRSPEACAMRSPETCPARGSFPPRAPPRLQLLTPGLGPQASTPRGSRVIAPRTSPAGRNLPETPQICKRVGLDAPLQIATRSGFFPSFLACLSAPRPPAARSRPRPAPGQTGRRLGLHGFKLPALPWSLEVALRAARLSGEAGMCVWTSGAGQAPGRAPGAEGLVPSSGSVGARAEAGHQARPKLELAGGGGGRAGLERLGDSGDDGAAGCRHSGPEVFSPQG